ncbi:MAG: hypothetical protein EXX96DRAFT_642177 [Benjaminiella poitrasii]|nr:MAG: hypothetical protein EXX96DRAFT_642177 [Benjaminiella poitrasii]
MKLAVMLAGLRKEQTSSKKSRLKVPSSIIPHIILIRFVGNATISANLMQKTLQLSVQTMEKDKEPDLAEFKHPVEVRSWIIGQVQNNLDRRAIKFLLRLNIYAFENLKNTAETQGISVSLLVNYQDVQNIILAEVHSRI